MRQSLLVMGANPAWQSTLFFAGLEKNRVNRASLRTNYPAGKGVNFCRAARCFGEADPLLLQFAGGSTGARLCAALDREGIRHETVETGAETRCCITCLDSADHTMTELIEPSSPVTPDEAAQFRTRLLAHIGEAALFAVTGSLPDGTDPALYRQAAEIALTSGVPMVIDAVNGIAPVLELPGRMVLKVNREELLRLAGADTVENAVRNLQQRNRQLAVAVTAGADEALFFDGEEAYRYSIPDLPVVNPLGAGDTAAAVLSSALAAGVEPPEAFRRALAAASANCLSEQAGQFRPEQYRQILPLVQIRKYTGIQ